MSESIKFSGILQKPETTEKVPLIPFKVQESGIPFYTDEACTNMVEDACIYILEALDPDDPIMELDVVPSTNKYETGSYLTLGYENRKLWEECWFRDPDTGEIQKAWNLHTNFIGEQILPESIEKEKDRIAELEKKMAEKAAATPSDRK